jgi:prophage tail gpP-like protein
MSDAVNIIINGQEYTDFLDVSINKSIETLAGSFSFTATSTPNINFPLKLNSECQIIVQGEQVINGYIEKLIIDYDDESHNIKVMGRDRTADLVDSTVGGSDTSQFTPPKNGITLKQFTENILVKFNRSSINVIDNQGTEPFNDVMSIDYGAKVFDFLEKYAKKRQVLLTTNGDGDIIFTRAPLNKFKTSLLLDRNNPSTILKGRIKYDNTKRFHKYVCTTQDNPSSLADAISLPSVIAGSDDEGGIAIDDQIRDSRIYHFEAEFSSDQKPLKDRAIWEANFRKSQSEQRVYTVQGHIAKEDEQIWKPGYTVLVVDELADLNSFLLISSVNYRFSLETGALTILKLLPEIAFSLLISKPEKEKGSKTGLGEYIDLSQLKVE